MINIAIVEDTEEDASRLESFLRRYFEGIHQDFHVFRYSNGAAFLDKFSARFDLIFLDIEMPGMNGIEVGKKIREQDPNVLIVFVTVMAQFALEGYEVNAFDFIVKPIQYYNFQIKMERALARIHQRKDAKLIVKGINGEVHSLLPEDIAFLEVKDNTMVYHLSKKGELEVTGQLSKIEPLLVKSGFFRCSRSYLVNLAYVDSVNEEGAVVGEVTLPVSRRRKKEFLQALAEYLGGGG